MKVWKHLSNASASLFTSPTLVTTKSSIAFSSRNIWTFSSQGLPDVRTLINRSTTTPILGNSLYLWRSFAAAPAKPVKSEATAAVGDDRVVPERMPRRPKKKQKPLDEIFVDGRGFPRGTRGADRVPKGPRTLRYLSMPIPEARYGMSVPLFLKLIGKDCLQHAGEKIKTWEDLFTWRRNKLKEQGVPIKQRRWILRWVAKYRQGVEPHAIRLKSLSKKHKAKRKAARDAHIELLKKVAEHRKQVGDPRPVHIPKIVEEVVVKKASAKKPKADKK
eukprot:TRINITY_DN4607_c0_g1_i1.p1 TRINITY_DN4607_c0_g1~~TRINITY_DN4607_c0_g1_i1.p1  ORF type:complete len:275 (-),score=32.82 TRINITY_DN4607_c0_g1_i1:37-861(-)